MNPTMKAQHSFRLSNAFLLLYVKSLHKLEDRLSNAFLLLYVKSLHKLEEKRQ
jgi:hypothetical protein